MRISLPQRKEERVCSVFECGKPLRFPSAHLSARLRVTRLRERFPWGSIASNRPPCRTVYPEGAAASFFIFLRILWKHFEQTLPFDLFLGCQKGRGRS